MFALVPQRSIGNRPLCRAVSTLPRGYAAIVRKNPKDVVITFAKRTAIGKHGTGQFHDTTVNELLHALFKATLSASKIDPRKIDDICVGTCYPPSPVYATRTAALASGIPQETTISQVNRLCASGLMSLRNIAHSIQSGEIEVGAALGVEVMSQHGKPTPTVHGEVADNAQAQDCTQHMGWTSEMVAKTFGISREKQDHYALIGHQRAEKASRLGVYESEIIPVEINGRTFDTDDTLRTGVTAEGLANLKPVWPQWGDGLTTAGNAGGAGDGAAICILTTRERAEAENWEILGKFVAAAVTGLEPKLMGVGPISAINKILAQLGLEKDDIDVWEINEAFASQFAYCVEQLQIPLEKINPNGGAFALSHPVGMTGLRQVVTGLNECRRTQGQILSTSMCVGAGMGASSIFVNEAH